MGNNRIKNCLFFLLTLCNLTTVFSQSIVWQNTIGGSNYEYLSSIELTNDGNYILGGYSQSNISGDKTENSRGINDFWITKIDNSTGTILWQKTIGGNSSDTATKTKQTKDGGYIIGGYSSSNISGEKSENSRGSFDYWVVRLDSNRNIIWDRTYGGNGIDRLWSIIETDDGGFLMGGESYSDISGDKTENSRGKNDVWIIKTDANGDIEWQKTFGGNDIDYLKSLTKANNGGYILAASSMSNISGEKSENSRGFGGDYWIIKIDDSGNIIWDKTIGGDNGDYAQSIIPTSDGNYIIGGDAASNISGEKTENSICISTDVWLVKINDDGNIIWDKTIGGESTEWVGNIQETKDKGIIIGSMSSSDISAYKTEKSVGDRDYWLVKLNKDGIIEWEKTLGGTDTDQLMAVIQAPDESYVLGGWSTSNVSGDKTENSNGKWDYWFLKFKNTSSSTYNPPNLERITVCEGQDLKLTAPSGHSFKWSGPENFTSTLQNPTLSNITNLNAGIYTCTLTNNANCTEVKIIHLTVTNASIAITPLTDVIACDDNNDNKASFNLLEKANELLNQNSEFVLDFLDGNGTSIPQPLPEAYINIIPNEEIITVKVSTKDAPSCYNTTSFKLIVSSVPNVTIDNIQNCDDNNDGFTEFNLLKYQENILNTTSNLVVDFYDHNNNQIPITTNYTNSIPNEEVITVKLINKANPNCFKTTTFRLIASNCSEPEPVDQTEFPNYFTPNNDALNDYWPNNTNNKFGIKRITIYNRFGTKLVELNQLDLGWDGTYNGQPMPSNDYWYKAEMLNGNVLKGNFSLIRK
ncbi:conserved protein of unknown function precursor containing a type B C-terminal secretion signal [Tenacibaculum sp. 190130A14a]|uniref:Gliding motility-associated C-terminal domain-containing protein n=1 Tax=Tenacibaculum polynesiense TaxID=3137857 RepID=A0ABM9PB85_9FLAO